MQASDWAGIWLSDMDSNHDKGLQRALCYRYTIGQQRSQISLFIADCNKETKRSRSPFAHWQERCPNVRAESGGEFFKGTAPHQVLLEESFKKSGCATLLEFCVHFSLSCPAVRTCIAGTSKVEHLNEILRAAENFKPLPAEIVATIRKILK